MLNSIGSIIFPSCLREFPNFTLSWAMISGFTLPAILLVFQIYSIEVSNFVIFAAIILIGLAYSYLFLEIKKNENVFKLSVKEIVKIICVAMIIATILLVPNSLTLHQPKQTALFVAIICFWSTQAIVAIRLTLKHMVK